MALSEQQRVDALTILANSGGTIPVFNLQPPKPLAQMTEAERDQFAKDAADQTGQLVDEFLANIYEMAATKYFLEKADGQRGESRD